MGIVNISAMNRSSIDSQHLQTEQQTKMLAPFVNQSSTLFIVQDDPIAQFKYRIHNYTDHVPNLHIEGIVGLNSASADFWKQIFAERVDSLWLRKGDIWIRTDVLARKPKAESDWVERQDPRIGWADIYVFFTVFDFEYPLPQDSSLARLPQTPRNKAIIDSMRRSPR
jgi:hypothetical protein